MRAPRPILERIPPESPVSPVLWFAVLGAPGAYAVQLGLGYWLVEAQCSPTGGEWGISLSTWAIIVTALAAAVAVASGVTSLLLYRRHSDRHEPPPPGRIAFLAIVGMTVSVLFLVLVLMTGAGILTFHVCNQS
jgi:amino acid transporter